MGISQHEARALIELHKSVGPFGRVATLGRQTLYVRRGSWRTLLGAIKNAPPTARMLGVRDHVFAEDFFRLLGATEVVSFDHSDYEGASIVHDMNLPIPPQWRQSFDCVYDGGTLEHVYNFPQAIKNCVDMLKVSGLFVCSTPANNFMGHGFYQFSPDLFFRLFSPVNEFRLERMTAFEYEGKGAWFEVEDPMRLCRRAELWGTKSRIILWVVARKLGTKSLEGLSYPKQSDYAAQWEKERRQVAGNEGAPIVSRRGLLECIDENLPWLLDCLSAVRDRWRHKQANRRGLSADRQAFRRIS